MEFLQISRFCKFGNLVIGSEEDFSLSECCMKLNLISSIEQISLDVLFQEDKSLFSYSVEVPQVLLGLSICLWESNLGLNFIRNERKLLSIVVLNLAWLWDMQTVADRMRSTLDQTKTNMVRLNKSDKERELTVFSMALSIF